MVVMVVVVVVCTVGHHCRCCRPFGPSRVWRFYKLVIHVDSFSVLPVFHTIHKVSKTKYTEITVWLAKQSAQKQRKTTRPRKFSSIPNFQKEEKRLSVHAGGRGALTTNLKAEKKKFSLRSNSSRTKLKQVARWSLFFFFLSMAFVVFAI